MKKLIAVLLALSLIACGSVEVSGVPNRPEPSGAREAMAVACEEAGVQCVHILYLGGTPETDLQYEVAVFVTTEADGNQSVHYVLLEGGVPVKVR